jgi:adenylosuccinate lyase
LIERYTLPEMADIWSEERKLRTWLEVELAIVDALAETGLIPAEAASRIKQNARFDAAKIREVEGVIKHDVLAFVECVGESLGDDSRYFHMGVTSSDVLDTSLAILIREAAGAVLGELHGLMDQLRRLALEHENTLTIGRTHGIHAEPTSLALKFTVWFKDMGRAIARLERATDEVCVGKVSGSVGNYSHLPPPVEDAALRALGLGVERPATQIVQRDRHAAFIASLALAAAVMEKIGVELRSLQRTEIAEVEEPFTRGQKGSSSMPHKRNPITLERICGLARLLRAHVSSALENIVLWHERDISHSSVERVIIPDSTTAVHYMARCMRQVLEGLRIDTDRMRRNIELTGGIVYSQRLMLCLMERGWQRREAYEKVQQIAAAATSSRCHLKDVAGHDEQIVAALGEDGVADAFDPRHYTKHTRQILQNAGIIQGVRVDSQS